MTSSSRPDPFHVAIVGCGPRGLAVLERLAAVLDASPESARPLQVTVIDSQAIATGRVWRIDQPEWFLMNTVAGEVSAFSGPPDGGPARPGAGPSLAGWWQQTDPDYPGPNGYASRARYGRYMHFVFEAIRRTLCRHAALETLVDSVVDLTPERGTYRLSLASGGTLVADRVILTPGHAVHEPDERQRALLDFARARPGLRVIAGDSAADMPLDAIRARSTVGVVGLGLSFYDVMSALTLGRGGRFEQDGARLRYRPSGEEPRIVAGSRSGMLLLARGRNQKGPDHRYTPAIFTSDRVQALRRGGRIDFAADVVPMLLAEVNLVYFQTMIRHRCDEAASLAFRQRLGAAGVPTVDEIRRGAAVWLGEDVAALDLDRVAHPFSGRTFASPQAFREALLAAVREDLEHAEAGNVDSPLKAALDVIRDTRGLVRLAVDFAGLHPASHRGTFQEWYVPRSAFLAAGPPRLRLQQCVALIEADVLQVLGPGVAVEADADSGLFMMRSPHVTGSATAVSTLVDARIPSTDIARDPSALTRRLREKGLWTNFVNRHADDQFVTGGVAVTATPYHPIGRDGRPDPGLYVLGIPTEHTRWFMQAGSNRPGFWTDFFTDADAIARDALAAAASPARLSHDPVMVEEAV